MENAARKKRLEECERVLRNHVEEFVNVGLALREIRDEKLYRDAECNTFEEYCRSRWQINDRHARRLIEAAEIRPKLPDPKPVHGGPVWTEGTVRELNRIPHTGKMVRVAEEVLDRVEKNGVKLTRTIVRKAVDQALGKRPWKKPTTPLHVLIIRYAQQLNEMAKVLESVPVDALELLAEDHRVHIDEVSAAAERVIKRLERIRPRARRR